MAMSREFLSSPATEKTPNIFEMETVRLDKILFPKDIALSQRVVDKFARDDKTSGIFLARAGDRYEIVDGFSEIAAMREKVSDETPHFLEAPVVECDPSELCELGLRAVVARGDDNVRFAHEAYWILRYFQVNDWNPETAKMVASGVVNIEDAFKLYFNVNYHKKLGIEKHIQGELLDWAKKVSEIVGLGPASLLMHAKVIATAAPDVLQKVNSDKQAKYRNQTISFDHLLKIVNLISDNNIQRLLVNHVIATRLNSHATKILARQVAAELLKSDQTAINTLLGVSESSVEAVNPSVAVEHLKPPKTDGQNTLSTGRIRAHLEGKVPQDTLPKHYLDGYDPKVRIASKAI